MPENLTIAAFVFGAVLTLLSLVGGGFKLFGAEVSGTAGTLGRTVAFVLGGGLITVGLLRLVAATTRARSQPAKQRPDLSIRRVETRQATGANPTASTTSQSKWHMAGDLSEPRDDLSYHPRWEYISMYNTRNYSGMAFPNLM